MNAQGNHGVSRLSQAGEWVQKVSGADPYASIDQLIEWCDSDEENLRAFERMSRLWCTSGGVQEPATVFVPRPNAASLWRRFAPLAAAALVLTAFVLWMLPRDHSQFFATSAGERRSIVLSDGSSVDLAPLSSLTSRLTTARRDVELTRGQAYFSVRHDENRPFVVHASGLTVTAVGTAFDVRSGSRTVVAVGEGRVQVLLAPVGAERGIRVAEPVSVTVGQQVTVGPATQHLDVTGIDLKAVGSWRSGTLTFQGEPLVEVVETINSYRQVRLALAVPLRSARFTGTVSLSRLDEWFHALEQIYDVHIVEQGKQAFVIQPARPQAPSH